MRRQRLGAAPRQPQRPADAADQVLLVAGILPDLFLMTQRGVENAPLAKATHPGDRVVLVRSIALRYVNRGRVDAHEDAPVTALPVAELIDLVRDLERAAE